ncbi:putative retrotransposon hot spot (RHS) protein [Trypanosoma cruzi]|uniref:Putative retrotransposon hot spot (RHS) protein n=1 Tax=Trypanosoma cruzi TaxID=5693 RepID=A0A2V2VQ60_TRYCR|nr:putative retrotransposon hot spot (RHS) protein [Trypanosoma cruzi]
MHTADIFYKACELHSFFLCGITVMHRRCGVYDLGFCVWPLLHRILFPLVSVFVCVRVYARTSFCQVCAVTAVPQGLRGRGERDAWTNPPRAPRCCYCLRFKTLCWVNVTHLPSLWCASHAVPSHRVDDSIAVAVSHACDPCFLLLFLFLFGG